MVTVVDAQGCPPRMIVTDGGLDVHAELPYGVTAEQIAITMIDHSTPGWKDDDPELEWL